MSTPPPTQRHRIRESARRRQSWRRRRGGWGPWPPHLFVFVLCVCRCESTGVGGKRERERERERERGINHRRVWSSDEMSHWRLQRSRPFLKKRNKKPPFNTPSTPHISPRHTPSPCCLPRPSLRRSRASESRGEQSSALLQSHLPF